MRKRERRWKKRKEDSSSFCVKTLYETFFMCDWNRRRKWCSCLHPRGLYQRVFINGLVYTLGRAISYTGLALIIFFGASKMNVSMLFQGWGEKLLGPVMILIGLFMLDVIKLNLPGLSGLTDKIGEKRIILYPFVS